MLGEVIAEARQQQGKSQRALADELYIGQSYLCHIERGIRRPGVQLLDELAERLHLSRDYLSYLAGYLPPDIIEAQFTQEQAEAAFAAMRLITQNKVERDY